MLAANGPQEVKSFIVNVSRSLSAKSMYKFWLVSESYVVVLVAYCCKSRCLVTANTSMVSSLSMNVTPMLYLVQVYRVLYILPAFCVPYSGPETVLLCCRCFLCIWVICFRILLGRSSVCPRINRFRAGSSWSCRESVSLIHALSSVSCVDFCCFVSPFGLVCRGWRREFLVCIRIWPPPRRKTFIARVTTCAARFVGFFIFGRGFPLFVCFPDLSSPSAVLLCVVVQDVPGEQLPPGCDRGVSAISSVCMSTASVPGISFCTSPICSALSISPSLRRLSCGWYMLCAGFPGWSSGPMSFVACNPPVPGPSMCD